VIFMLGRDLQPLFHAECPYCDLGLTAGRALRAGCFVADTTGVPLLRAQARIQAADRPADPGADGEIRHRGKSSIDEVI
jgi:hypothetical protein